MKTKIDVELHSVELPETFTAKLNWPRSSRPARVNKQPLAPTAPIPPPATPSAIPTLNLRAGQLDSDQVEWLIEDFAERLRAKANVRTPPTAEAPALEGPGIVDLTHNSDELQRLHEFVTAKGFGRGIGENLVDAVIDMLSSELDKPLSLQRIVASMMRNGHALDSIQHQVITIYDRLNIPGVKEDK